MAITFDSTNKLIMLPDVTSITAQEIYNAAMDWADEPEAMDDDVPMLSTGFALLGGGVYTDKIFVLANGWKLKPYSGTYILTITGTIITDDASPRTVPPDSGEVQFVFQVTSQGIVSIQGSGVTQQDKEDIADLVEEQTGSEIKDQLTDVEALTMNVELHHIGRVKIEGDYMLVYDTLENLIAKYHLIKDSDGRIIERVPESV